MQFQIPIASRTAMVLPNDVKTDIKLVQLVNLVTIGVSIAVPIPSNETQRSHSMLLSSIAIAFCFLNH
jgi:hypothetical protein